MDDPYAITTAGYVLMLVIVVVATGGLVWLATASYYRGRISELLRAAVEERETAVIQGTHIRKVP